MNQPASTHTSLITQLTTGPSMREVATNVLRPALKEMYPQLDIDPDLAVVVSPLWQVENGAITPAASYRESLSGALARHAVSAKPVVFLDGEHYLTYRYDSGPEIHLPVRIDDIARLINELAPLLFVAFQEQQLDYWNQTNGPTGTRWQTLAVSLRKVWDIQDESWEDDDRAVARMMFNYPDYALRQSHDKYGTRAYLVDVDVSRAQGVEHLSLTPVAVMIASHQQQTIILAYSIATGHEKFDTMEDLGKALSRRASAPGIPLHWRLFEPEGDFFEHQACTLIGLQIDAITDFAERDSQPQSSGEIDPLRQINPISATDQQKLQWLSNALPQWLQDAPQADLSSYSRYLLDLATLNGRQANQTYQDGIAPIRDYALQAIRDRMIADHPEATSLKLQNLRISVTSQQVLGLFTAPGLVSTQTFELADLALENLIALPLGNKTLHYSNGSTLPAWLTVSYLEGLINQVNVGQHYPALVKRLLLDDPVESLRRQTLYIDQLRLQLPLLALQYKVRRQFGVDETGYRYVCALLEPAPSPPKVDGQVIVIRPLGFIPTRRLSQTVDKVANMFVIGPQASLAGPCLLYRPLSNTPLMQFASRANLLYAIKQDTPLRQAVLAWLPEQSRFSYAQFVFPGTLASPWVLSKLLIEPLTAVVMSGPMAFTDEVLGADYLATLFKANARALVELADQQSVSNAEARWESFKHAGWLIFNAALPFLGKTVGTAAWIGQLMDDLQQAIDADDSGDHSGRQSAVLDILLNLGMALALQVASRQKPPRPRSPGKAPAEEGTAPRVTPAAQHGQIETARLPAGHESSLHSLGALVRNPLSLAKTLDSFSLAKPKGLGAPHDQPGPHQHLSPWQQQWYAPVGQRWFQVVLDENDSVIVVDPKDLTRQGPVLINNRLGEWFIDTRLRLRGGGFRSRRKKGQRLKPAKVTELREQLNAFDEQKLKKTTELQSARDLSRAAPSSSAQAERAVFTHKLLKRREDYETPIAQLKSLNILDTVPDYAGRMTGYLRQQILLTRSAIDEEIGDYRELLTAIEPHLEGDSAATADHRHLDEMTRQQLQHLEYLHARFKDLQGLGADGVALIEEMRPHIPRTDINDLKALRVTLTRYLCLPEGADAAASEARQAINRVCDAADLAIHSLHEMQQAPATLNERIEALDSLVDQFAVINQDCLDLPAEFPGELSSEPLEFMRTQTDEFAQRATRQLVMALRERKTMEDKVPTAPAEPPRRKIIKTRARQVVVGEPRPNDPSLVDVRDALTHKVIATFHEKDGVWVRHEPVRRHKQRPQAPGLKASMKTGQALLADNNRFIERTKGLAGEARRLPVEIEEKIQRRAEKLEQAAKTIEHAANATNQTDNRASTALRQDLEEAVRKLFRESRRIRLEMLKKRPPTAANVETLYIDKEITIQLLGARRRLKGPGKDYLQEYEIRDRKTSRILWYAHFHYAALDAANEAYTAAHLKTLDQRRLGGAFELRGDPDQVGIAVYRSEIGPHLARLLFLNPQPAAAQPTPGSSASMPG